MPITLSKEAQAILDAALASGRYSSPEAAIEAGLALLTDRHKQYLELRESIRSAIAERGRFSDEEVAAAIEEELDDWERKQEKRPSAAE